MPIILHNLTLVNKFSFSSYEFPFKSCKQSCKFPQILRVSCAQKAKRTGKLRYPSEKKKLRHQKKTKIDEEKKFEGVWRLFRLGVPVHEDPGKDFWSVSEALLKAIAKVLEFPVPSMLPPEAFTVIRKSFDARKKEKKFVYTVDMDVHKLISIEPRTVEFVSELEPKAGFVEFLHHSSISGDLMNVIRNHRSIGETDSSSEAVHNNRFTGGYISTTRRKPRVVVVGSGPSGLFASLVLAEAGADVTLIERGNAVEQRGRDIGALVVRRMLQLESNFCFGEGGAGTWSDGKLVTRIGRNNSSVLTVLKTLVHFGAPCSILVDGKPHLGTDRLIPLLRNFRRHLQELGVTILFGTRVDDLLVKGERVVGVKISDSGDSSKSGCHNLECDAVVLAVGHSARDTYQMLLSHNVDIIQKDFAVGLRIEHPQELINNIQYSELACEVQRGRGKVPVADYQIAERIKTSSVEPIVRNCYSFCMCPGGQVVLTSTDQSELCINGMSFSRRSSRWANAALVVTVSSKDFEALNLSGPLAGVGFQRAFEQKAAVMGGGNFVVPVQTVTDFLENRLSVSSLPPSSYRLGVKASNLHELFPTDITEALQSAISMFDEELPGFASSNALLHGVETRTSSPVQITRTRDTWESTSMKGLYPVGEGAGYAGGIVSAAVDGMHAGFALARNLGLLNDSIGSVVGKAQNVGFVKY
ncbi:FAD/NAD(P)-binding oxidoreductase family protein [Striga hermonthica]|uniref:FAD/NAD(P)-binding oxidoreductase family protein n=1 Tax=Striga hermonthica TaxID=68872 RepID=A0A9N7RAS5_STRHE|nr:FAD/NAD(P)-binding oxidoreductase family protein [Striga hermonthica]